jgi:predicted metallo-beta-lactamase superfamily hydrolase
MLKVLPLAFESLGVRSMATFVEAKDEKIIIDPAAALAPERYGLPPHPLEEQAKAGLWNLIKGYVARSSVIIVTHFHFDHFDPNEPEIYLGKKVFLKDPRRMINNSQRNRGNLFLRALKGAKVEVEISDGGLFQMEGVELKFSKPVPHGPSAERGYVLEVSLREDDVFLFTSDVQGPLLEEQVQFILDEEPDILFVDGPTTYLESPYASIELRKATENLIRIFRETQVKRVVIDHHLSRDLNYAEKIKAVLESGEENGVEVGCAAEFLNERPRFLEARRMELYSTIR